MLQVSENTQEQVQKVELAWGDIHEEEGN